MTGSRQMVPRSISLLLTVALVATITVACGSDDTSSSETIRTSESSSSTPTAVATATATKSAPTATPTPALKYPGMVVDLKQGDFWEFRWEWKEQSCSQGSGCRNGGDGGLFKVTLGVPRTIGGAEMFPVTVSGNHTADNGAVDFAPAWKFVGVDGPRLLGSNGSNVVSIFDALDGQWTGGGFFSRFGNNETHAASATSISTVQPFGAWNGVRTGPAITVVRSDSQSMCEIIEGRRICPNDSSFSLSETQYYRNEVGPLGYSYRFSASFSGGNFFSSNSSEEHVALVRSSLRGDVATPDTTPTPTPAPVPTPTAAPTLDVVFGPADGVLVLTSVDNQIPDLNAGVNLVTGVIDVTFVNPDVGNSNWSYGVTFRHSGEETFHAVYVTGGGQWEHFVRGGSAESQVSPGRGTVSLNLGVGEENRLTVLFNPTVGGFWVNGELIAELDLSMSEARLAGDVRVMAGVLNTDVYSGAASEFYDLTIATE